ncbi:substrate-binding domain-containing protein [Lactobacillus sp. R2/2]|nr:substrate-binding domain-containing protein [Lactobacillus sp. R2/2]
MFATNDSLAVNIILAARDINVNVPKDLKVIGFDDAPIAQYSVPELTTIHQDVQTIAKIACTKLIEQVTKPKAEKGRRKSL